MHEWALAEAVIATVENIRSEHGGRRVLAVRLRIGELQAIDREAFQAGLQMSLEGRPYGPEVFQLLSEPARFRCRVCRREWRLDERTSELGAEELEAIHFLPESAHVYMRCPGCGGPDFELAAGRGVTIESVDLERGLD
jgi:hydrogenase nickel incorporation protein HypA/HybF